MRQTSRQAANLLSFLALAIGLLEAPTSRNALAVERIKLLHEGGVYRVPALINDQLVKLFVLDSGSAEVQVPAEVFLSLFPETVGPQDFLPGSAYKLADGRVVQSERFRLRTLKLGNRVFRDVPASISDPGTPLLLGQGVLGRLRGWRIDNHRQVLVLDDEKLPAGSGQFAGLPKACLLWQTAPIGCAVGFVREYYMDLKRADATAAAQKWNSIGEKRIEGMLAVSEDSDVQNLTLLQANDRGAVVFVDLVAKDRGKPPVRWCGPLELLRSGRTWRIATTRGIRELPVDTPCAP